MDLGAPSRAELAAAGGLLTYLDATQKGAGILLDAPRRIARSSHMAIDAATRDSLELTRSVTGSVAGSLLGEIDRCESAAGRRLLAEDIGAPLTDKSRDRGAARAGVVAARGCDPADEHAAAAQGDAGCLARRWRGWRRGEGARATSLCCATASPPPARCGVSSKAKPTARHCSTLCCPGSAATMRWSTSFRGRWSTRRRSMRPRAAISRRAMTRRSTSSAKPLRTAAARLPRSRRATATPPAFRRSRSATMRCSAIISKSRPGTPTG